MEAREGWISDSRQVLHFRPVSDARWNQALEITVGELMPGGEPPLLKRRMQLRRAGSPSAPTLQG